MSEEMKLILALIEHLGLEATCKGHGVSDGSKIEDAIFARDKRGDYTYTVAEKR